VPFVLGPFLLAVATGLLLCQIGNFATTIYLHRTLSHRAMTLHPVVAWLFRFVVWTSTGLRPRQWVAVHRKHHAFTDVDGDPHSPRLLGWTRVLFGNVGLYRRVAGNPEQVARYAKDLPPDRWDRVLFDRAWLGLGLGITVLILIFGPWLGLVAAATHALSYLFLGGAVNGIAHTFGRRPYDNGATNLQWLALLTMGEGLHNNHHAAPTSAKLALSTRQFDPAWPAIATFRKLGLATIRHDRPKLKGLDARPESREPVAVG
jgi:stearoyl-CoA desaturase (Delta-9 desaturase)